LGHASTRCRHGETSFETLDRALSLIAALLVAAIVVVVRY
jgi:hypothetical protein